MRNSMLLACVMSLAMMAAGPATRPTTQPTRGELERIYGLVEELGDVDVVKREAATDALIEMGMVVRVPLEGVLAKNDNPEVRARVKRILMRCAGAGDVVNGLQIRLRSDRKTLRMGETMTLTSEIVNTTDRPMNLYVGYSTGGEDFLSGAALRGVNGPVDMGKPQWMVGFCGTGAGPLYVTIPAGKSISYDMPVTMAARSPQHHRLNQMPHGALLLGIGQATAMPLRGESGVQALRIEHTVGQQMNVPEAQGFPGGGRAAKDPKAPYWTGRIESNTVEIRLEARAK